VSADDEVLRRRTGDAAVVRRAFEDLPFPVLVLEGPEHRVVAATGASRVMVGRSEVIDVALRELFPEFAGQQIIEILDHVYASGEPHLMRGWHVDLALEERGEQQEVVVDVEVVPRVTAEGAVHGIVCTISDMTPQLRKQVAAREQAAVAERRIEKAQDVIAVLQRELLPPGLPVLPQVSIAGSYLLADAYTAAGGDWFDAVVLPGGRVGLVVGDVVGHGVAASAVMGQLRTVVSERLSAGAAIRDVLAAVDAVAGRLRGARAATVCVAVLDPAEGSLTYCTAGHPPPLLVPAHGEPRYLPVTGAGPLGVGTTFTTGTDRLGPGDVLLLYTDGIIERPGRDVAVSTVELAQVTADAVAGRALQTGQTSPVERACTQTLELLVRSSGHTDDITLLAAQRINPNPGLQLTVPAEAAALAATRAAIGDWLEAVGAVAADAFAVLHAVGELVTNAVEHAYAAPHATDSPKETLTVRGRLSTEGHLRIEVVDRGSWRDGSAAGFDPGAAGRGRGLAMSGELMDELHIDATSDGTTATVVHRLWRPARLLTAPEIMSGTRPSPERADEPASLLIVDQPTSYASRSSDGADDEGGAADGRGGHVARIRVDGPVDAASAPQLHAELQRRSRGGSRGMIVDLSGVTHLASAGVAVLFQAVRGAGPGAPLRLYAPVGSIAGHVLDLVALPYEIRDPRFVEQ
jgi:serine phosphatase RsbU (regulator of sigma subunit)/anti-sigma regulatory factor (Ser/Thr protein kinase)